MIVFDVSALVGATIRRDSVPELALRQALRTDRIAMSEPVMSELLDVLDRPRLARFLDPAMRTEVISLLYALGVFFVPTTVVADCRDAKDNKYLDLALAAAASVIVSSDRDLLVLDPWRGVRILRPSEYFAQASSGGS